jgi:glycosyltransferase involved in cell wall biosynthesis
MALERPIRLLYWAREEFPTFRVDLDVLFGKELIGRGQAIDFVMPAASSNAASGAVAWRGRTVYVGPAAGAGTFNRIAKHFRIFWHDLKSLRLARASNYDAIQFRDKFIVAAIGLIYARARGLKYFYWLSFPYPEIDRLRAREGHTRYPLFAHLRGITSAWLLYRWILPRCDHAFVQSERMKQDVAAEGIDPASMTSVPMGVDLSDIPRRPGSPAEMSGGDVVLTYLGTFDADRHIEMLVDMLAELRGQQHRVRLLLVGDAFDARDREALQQRADRLGVLQFMEITGNLPRLQALERTRSAHIGLSPYFPTPVFLSTSPTKLIEYLALGLPVVASAHPEQRVILRESGAGVYAPWGARHFARSVRWLLRRSAVERAAMGSAGRAWVEGHRTYSKICDDLERKYLDLLPPARTVDTPSPDRRT